MREWKHSKIHLTLVVVWFGISLLAFILGWAGAVWFVSGVSLYTIIVDHLVGFEASKAKENNEN